VTYDAWFWWVWLCVGAAGFAACGGGCWARRRRLRWEAVKRWQEAKWRAMRDGTAIYSDELLFGGGDLADPSFDPEPEPPLGSSQSRTGGGDDDDDDDYDDGEEGVQLVARRRRRRNLRARSTGKLNFILRAAATGDASSGAPTEELAEEDDEEDEEDEEAGLLGR